LGSLYSVVVPVRVVDHPIAQDALARLRDSRTPPDLFRQLATRLSLLVAAEATRDLVTRDITVQTPLGAASGRHLGSDVVVVPILRAGLGMLDAILSLLPHARVGHIGLERSESTAKASRYYAKLPDDLSQSDVLLIDPMLATGGSCAAAIDLLRHAGARHVTVLCLVAAPEGIASIRDRFPDITIVTPAVDRELNAQKFIVPGLGDFGDRLYGTRLID